MCVSQYINDFKMYMCIDASADVFKTNSYADHTVRAGLKSGSMEQPSEYMEASKRETCWVSEGKKLIPQDFYFCF